jgi:signal transduction histidine kinase
MTCPRCQHKNRAPAKFCEECATPLKAASPGGPSAPSYADVTSALSAALEQQTATSEILRVISQSPTDTQPVFYAIVERALRLSEATVGAVTIFDGELIHVVASNLRSDSPILRVFPMRPSRTGSLAARTVFERRIIHVPDALAEPEYNVSQQAAESGYRSVLSVPMLREGTVVGTITVGRSQAGRYLDRQIALLQTFADQAVIAIENVRMFKELEARNRDLTEALDQQTATSEILRVISSSPTNIEPVLDALVRSATRFCGAHDAQIFLSEGDNLRVTAHHGPISQDLGSVRRLERGTVVGRSLLDRRAIHVADLQAEVQEFPEGSEFARRLGHRTILSVPLLRESAAIGVIQLRRAEVNPFSDKQAALLQTFADQAVIAIENVRLFTELQEKNQALTEAHAQVTEALEQQTATSELLKVIGRSTFDLQPVFETLAENAVRLCGATQSSIFRFDGQVLRVVATHNASSEVRGFLEQNPIAPGRQSGSARAALERRTIHIHDAQSDPEYTYGVTQVHPLRTVLAIPMLRANDLLGVIFIYREEVQPFTDSQVALMETFADQAAIATENARLLSELQRRTQELTRSVGELTALGEVGRVLSSTLNLETVLQTVVLRANELARTAGCTIWEYDTAHEEFRLRASHYADPDDAAILQALGRAATIRRGQGVTTRVVDRREAVQIADITTDVTYESPIRRPLIDAGHRGLLGVPLLSEDEVIGVLTVTRKIPGEFEPATVRLLSTFATQSALAIQNARLFLEIEDKSRQLEVASRHKSEFLANMSHELRTPLNAILGFSEVLAEGMFGEVNDKQAEYLRDILESGRHLLSLINDILDLSKIEAGRMELEPTDFDVPSAIDNALALVRERAGRRGITLGRQIDGRVGMIRADERKVKQVVLNLLSNAIKFTPEGGRIDVRAAVNEGAVEVSVADTGVGIAPEDQDKVFEEFRQVGTADKKVEGTGLGLALSRKFVELHGGRIWVKSDVGVDRRSRSRCPRAGRSKPLRLHQTSPVFR